VASRSRDRDARITRERTRAYLARQTVHEHRVRRRRRDNFVAVGALVVVAALATVAQVFYFSGGPGTPSPEPSASASATPEPEAGENVGDVPDPAVAEGRAWTGELVLNDVPLGISLDGAAAPQGVASFITDAKNGYFTGKSCHRLVKGEGAGLIQCGSEDGTGASSPDYAFGPVENAPADGVYPAGTIALARADTAYTNGHQFFIVFDDTTLPDPTGYTVLGTVTSGLDALKAGITDAGLTPGSSDTDGSPVVPTTITSVSVQ